MTDEERITKAMAEGMFSRKLLTEILLALIAKGVFTQDEIKVLIENAEAGLAEERAQSNPNVS
jgi:hypothetical protein